MTEEVKVKPLSVVVDYAPAKGKRSPCHLSSCEIAIERGQLRIKEEYSQPIDGGEAIHRYHLECYPFPVVISKLDGFHKLKEEDQKKVISKFGNSEPEDDQSEENDKEESEEEEEVEEEEQEEEAQAESGKGSQKVEKTSPVSSSDAKSAAKYRNGSKIMAKVQGNVARNIWFPAKVISSRISALGTPEYHVLYLEDNVEGTKEWVPDRFVAPPILEDEPPPSTFTEGMIALGWRRKPGSTIGWWYSVKVLRFLRDVPGAFVHWSDFPFPDSILEATKMHLIQPQEAAKPAEVPQQKGVKRQMTEGDDESLPKKEKHT